MPEYPLKLIYENISMVQICVLEIIFCRYTMGDAVMSGTLGLGGIHLCYHQKASEQLQLAVELETNFRMQESVASIGYQVDLPKADLTFRGSKIYLLICYVKYLIFL